jgi:hypothetical protein
METVMSNKVRTILLVAYGNQTAVLVLFLRLYRCNLILLPQRNWHPFGKILVSDVPKAFALNSQFGKNARHSKFLPVA